jgi:hypothetical protein
MKTVMSILCAVALTSTTIASPVPVNNNQPVPINPQSVQKVKFSNEFGKVNVHRQQKGILLTWIFTDPNNVVSFVVQRSYDNEFFETAGEVPSNGKNQYKDNDVFPGHIYYRIAALMYDGSTIYSNVEAVRIVRNG